MPVEASLGHLARICLKVYKWAGGWQYSSGLANNKDEAVRRRKKRKGKKRKRRKGELCLIPSAKLNSE